MSRIRPAVTPLGPLDPIHGHPPLPGPRDGALDGLAGPLDLEDDPPRPLLEVGSPDGGHHAEPRPQRVDDRLPHQVTGEGQMEPPLLHARILRPPREAGNARGPGGGRMGTSPVPEARRPALPVIQARSPCPRRRASVAWPAASPASPPPLPRW